MKKLLREKLLETRREFEKLEEKEKYKSFMLEVDLCFDKSQNVIIKFLKIYENENGEYNNFAEEELLETYDSNVDAFIELLSYAENRYCEQFIYAIHPFIYCFYGNEMDTRKFKYILSKGNKDFLAGKMGFAIKENIF